VSLVPAAPGVGEQDGAAGFTLAELLVALVLLGLISVALVGGLRFGSRAWEAGLGKSAALEDVASAQAFLRRQISQTKLPLETDYDVEKGAMFLGHGDRMQWTSPWLSPVGAGGLYVFELDAPEENGTRSLRVRWTLRTSDWAGTFDDDTKDRRMLMANIQDLRIRYYGDPDLVEEPAWVPLWPDAFSLPRLIEIDVGLPEGDSRTWPPLVVAPQAQAVGR
jgi:general secretion pathway protein J